MSVMSCKNKDGCTLQQYGFFNVWTWTADENGLKRQDHVNNKKCQNAHHFSACFISLFEFLLEITKNKSSKTQAATVSERPVKTQ